MSNDGDESLELICLLDNVQGLVDALACVRWKRQQDAICELSEHGVVIMVEEWSCLQARVYFRKELFRTYVYQADVRPRFGVSLGLLVDSLSTFTSSTGTTALEFRYPGPDMQLLLKLIDANETCMYAEIRTRIPDTIPRDFSVEDDSAVTPQSFAVKSAALKEAIDDLEWPGSSIQLSLCPDPPSVIFRGEGHGDLQIDFLYNAQGDLFIAFQCSHPTSYKYKYKFLKATTANIPAHILKDNRGSKLTISSSGLLKVQHLIPVRLTAAQQQQMDTGTNQQQSRVSYIEFYVMPEEENDQDMH
ncbi:hypothetical protein GOP47_0025951 [Adiantum capillus-veneris]|uniref:Cell cycle checkpoint protein RAD1 n=1 Tax=Adiantum capillus-veneris TaxID=13818 RepID=A0A9D4Z412_ADICA|nr:hypothetical protein GOP47_0025951 [Adiantum capillus-veneris]